MNETTTEIASLQQDNARLRQENTRLKKSKDKLGLTYKTTAENGDAQMLLQGSIPFLKRIDELSVMKNDNEPNHLLIEGDNISSLTILQQTHREKVDVIYIDPPYNTGNEDFVYNDNFKDKQPKGVHYVKRDDSFRHSKWLSFMKPRLELAKSLLKTTGVIFVSIDDNEQAYLKILMDEVFGSQNFVGELIRKTKSTTNDAGTGFNTQHESCLIFAKDSSKVRLEGAEKDLSRYTNPDDDPRGPWASDNPSAKSGTMENGWFPVVNPYTGKEDYPPEGRFWVFSKNTIQKHIDNGTIVFKKKYRKNERGFIYKRHLSQLKTTKQILNSLDTVDNRFMNQAATKESLKVIGDSFTYPKGIAFLKHILSFVNKSAIVLDFFAGSGTTGQAVAELNKEDGGTRQAILCTNNFEQDGTENGIARGITAERMRRVLTGKDWADGKEHDALPGNLTYYQVSFRNNESYINDYVENFTASQISGIAALETNAHNVLGAEDFDDEPTREFINSGKIVVLSSSSRIVLVYGDLETALYFDEKFDEVEQSVKTKSDELGKSFTEYLISYNDDKTSEIDENTTVENFPIPYVNCIGSSVRTLEVKRLLVRPDDCGTTPENDDDEGAPMNDN